MLRWGSNILCGVSFLLSLMLLIYGVIYAEAVRGIWAETN